MEAGTESQDTGAETAADTQAPAVDLAPLLERFDDMAGRFGSLQEQLTSQFAPEAEEDDLGDWGAGELFENDGSDVDPQAAQALLANIVDQRTSKAVQEAVGPLMQQIQEIQIQRDSDDLVARYPELEKPEIAQPVVQAASQLAQQLGKPELATSPQLIEVIFKAQMADKYAAGERPVGDGNQFDLESAGGAGPQVTEASIAERIKNARQGNSFWTG